MDWSVLEDAGLLLMKIKMYPYFDIAHYILMCLVVRDDINQLQLGIIKRYITQINFS
jgi:hypothetical protein